MVNKLQIFEPEIRTYLGDAFCFSIINEMAFKGGWVFDKYIDLEYTKEDHHIKYYGYDYYDFLPDENIFIKSFTQIPIELCSEPFICGIIEDMIDRGEYFVGFWNETVIYNYMNRAEINSEFEHLCFIYGYDSNERIFFSEGYVKENKWQRFVIPYDVMADSLVLFEGKKEVAFNGYQVLDDFRWITDKHAIVDNLKEYPYKKNLNIEAECLFFQDVLIYKTIHLQSVYCIYEHKMLMKKRVKYLFERRCVSLGDRELVCSSCSRLVNECRSLVLLAIKYQNSNELIDLKKFIDHADKMVSHEKNLMNEIVSIL